MGITIHYRGRINQIEDVEKLTVEVEDFARELGWKFQRWNEDWSKPNTAAVSNEGDILKITGHVPLRGIDLHPHKHSEWLSLTFTPNGYLTDILGMTLVADGTKGAEELWTSIKTQFAPIGTHIAVVKLLKYIKEKYIHNLEVHDDGGYWETGDIEELKYRRDAIHIGMDIIEDALSDIPPGTLDNKSPDETGDYIENILRKRFGK